MISINPVEYGIAVESRIVIYDIKRNTFDRLEIISPNSTYTITDDHILNKLADFKYKIQVKSENKWIDATRYIKLYDDTLLDNIFCEKIQMDYQEFKILLEEYWSNYTINHHQEIKTAFANSMRRIFNHPNDNFKNLKNLIDISENTKIIIPLLWKNIIIYTKEMIKLNDFQKTLGISGLPFLLLNDGEKLNNQKLLEYVNSRISFLANYNLEFSTLLIGLYNSYIGNRDLAFDFIRKALDYDEQYILEMKLDIGSYTYVKDTVAKEFKPIISYHHDTFKGTNQREYPTILLSMDSKFLRLYSVQLFYSIIALDNYHFHLHIIEDGNGDESIIKDAIDTFRTIQDFMNPKSKSVTPSFSSEIYPSFVKSNKTYYACSRYIVADSIMDKFDNDIFIMDVDFFINDDLSGYFKRLSEFDIAVPFANALQSIIPWRRIKAGYVYVSNNKEGIQFLKFIQEYILNNLNKSNSWTLDQNALSFAYEKINSSNPNVSIGNASDIMLPMEQPALRKIIERL